MIEPTKLNQEKKEIVNKQLVDWLGQMRHGRPRIERDALLRHMKTSTSMPETDVSMDVLYETPKGKVFNSYNELVDLFERMGFTGFPEYEPGEFNPDNTDHPRLTVLERYKYNREMVEMDGPDERFDNLLDGQVKEYLEAVENISDASFANSGTEGLSKSDRDLVRRSIETIESGNVVDIDQVIDLDRRLLLALGETPADHIGFQIDHSLLKSNEPTNTERQSEEVAKDAESHPNPEHSSEKGVFPKPDDDRFLKNSVTKQNPFEFTPPIGSKRDFTNTILANGLMFPLRLIGSAIESIPLSRKKPITRSELSSYDHLLSASERDLTKRIRLSEISKANGVDKTRGYREEQVRIKRDIKSYLTHANAFRTEGEKCSGSEKLLESGLKRRSEFLRFLTQKESIIGAGLIGKIGALLKRLSGSFAKRKEQEEDDSPSP